MRVAVIGSGGREHAIQWALARHHAPEDIFVLPGNGGTGQNVAVDPASGDAVLGFCRERRVDLVIVGPEGPLGAGLVDRLRAEGVSVLGPTREAAQLETSKVFSKHFMKRHGVATPGSWTLEGGDDPRPVLDELRGDLVLKFDGLAAGKGVWVCRSPDEAERALGELYARHGRDARYLIEERLDGDELSVIGFTDGKCILLLPPAQDHKALLDGDSGPNTGGMGAFSPVPQITPSILRQIEEAIVAPTLAGLQADRLDFRGLLYFGLMLTSAGPRLLEYNVRLGDPEAQVILPRLGADLAEVARACVDRRLHEVRLDVSAGFTVGVVLAARGYPDRTETGQAIHGLGDVPQGALVFHAGTRRDDVGGHRTNGGRVLTVVGRGDDLPSTIERAYAAARTIRFDGMQLRHDIGRRTWHLPSSE